jgi:DNA-binding IclR family transcriptional regulator
MGPVAGTSPLSQTEFDQLVSETRRHGLSRSLGRPIPGIDALCAPVFDSAGNIVVGLLAMGPSATFESTWDGKVASALRRCAEEVSRRLGYENEAKLEVA